MLDDTDLARYTARLWALGPADLIEWVHTNRSDDTATRHEGISPRRHFRCCGCRRARRRPRW
jgi:hypothetical protein